MLNFWIQLGEGIDLPKEDRDYHISDSKLKHNLRVEGAKKVHFSNTYCIYYILTKISPHQTA